MAHTSDADLLVLHALRVRGLAEHHHISESTGLSEFAVSDYLAEAAAALVTHRDGRMSGWTLTPAGRAAHAARLREERTAAACDEEVRRGYERFVDANGDLKILCTDWQLRSVGGQLLPNDHTDASYDQAIAARLSAFHAGVAPVVDGLAEALSRFAPYRPRLAGAVARFAAGEGEALARPLTGSYHDVWMELHQDLLLTLDRERSAADGH